MLCRADVDPPLMFDGKYLAVKQFLDLTNCWISLGGRSPHFQWREKENLTGRKGRRIICDPPLSWRRRVGLDVFYLQYAV